MTDTMREPSDARIEAAISALHCEFDGEQPDEWTSGSWRAAARAVLAAADAVLPQQAAPSGEAAWQSRVFIGGQWTEWKECEPLNEDESLDYTYPDSRVRYQFRKLYTHPAPAPAAVPAGYALVPVEPTPEMLIAGFSSVLENGKREVAKHWAAMLSAAPPPPNQQSGAAPAEEEKRCPECLSPDCNGECSGDGAMGD